MARMTYDRAIEKLNSRNLHSALEFSCLLSCLDFASERSLSPKILHNELVRLIAEGVIKSSALWYKSKAVDVSDVRLLFNGVVDALHDRRLEKEVISGRERTEMLYALTRVFARIGYLQLRPQQDPYIPFGRLLAIVESIPTNNPDYFPENIRGRIEAFLEGLRVALGSSLGGLVRAHAVIVNYFLQVGNVMVGQLPVRPSKGFNFEHQMQIVELAVRRHLGQDDVFRLRMSWLKREFGDSASDLFGPFLKIFGRPIKEHRACLKCLGSQIGPPAYRLSSLDRYPLVAAGDGDSWYAPNVRLLFRSAPDVVHFAINDYGKELDGSTCEEVQSDFGTQLRKDYEAIRGLALELYCQQLLGNRLPELTVIAEKRWRSGKGESSGPDLIIIDHSSNPVVIAVEIKSRLMTPELRYGLSDGNLVSHYRALWNQMNELPGKVARAFDGVGDYLNDADELARAKDYPVYYLGVVGEAPIGFGELVENRRGQSDFPLGELNAPAAVMSADTFERFVEVTVQHGRPLIGVLRQYIDECCNLEMSGSYAENFMSYEIDEKQTYAVSFLRPLIPEIF